MKKTIRSLVNKAICAAFVVLGAFAASAELVKEPIYDAENVSVGYKVTGLNDGKEEAVVFTNHLRTATWTVPANLENVQFLVVGGGGGGGGGTWGPGGGGGGVVTGYVYQLKKDVAVDITVGAGGNGGTSNVGATTNPGKKGTDSAFKVGDVEYVRAYAGGASGSKGTSNKDGGSGAGAIPNKDSVQYGGSATKGTYNVELVKGWEFGNGGGTNTIKRALRA